MFIFKKIIASFLYPLPLSLLISLLGLYLLWFTAKQKTGKILVSVGVIILTLFSCSVISNKLLRPLERKYDSFEMRGSSSVSKTEDESTLKYVVVLGGGHTSDSEFPLMSQIGRSSLVRLIEGIRIYREYPGSKLIVSGGIIFDPVPEAEVLARVAIETGVPESDIILESKSKDTKDQAKFIKPIVGNEPFVLVTSASHIPRSMALFKKLGMNPIPSPIGHRVSEEQGFSSHSFFPGTVNLRKAELAIHEYLGLVWSKLRDQQQDRFSTKGVRMSLSKKECALCKGGVLPLKGEELEQLKAQVDGWDVVEEHHISKTHKFPNFVKALAFVNKVGEIAEEQGHHPDIFLAWGKVSITICTHKINGLTESDFILAAKIDEIPVS
jgi:uncharacterized SAM-binding protein YcdF (DUF218 family)/pterin-4a-carbinolamine dehydratase